MRQSLRRISTPPPRRSTTPKSPLVKSCVTKSTPTQPHTTRKSLMNLTRSKQATTLCPQQTKQQLTNSTQRKRTTTTTSGPTTTTTPNCAGKVGPQAMTQSTGRRLTTNAVAAITKIGTTERAVHTKFTLQTASKQTMKVTSSQQLSSTIGMRQLNSHLPTKQTLLARQQMLRRKRRTQHLKKRKRCTTPTKQCSTRWAQPRQLLTKRLQTLRS